MVLGVKKLFGKKVGSTTSSRGSAASSDDEDELGRLREIDDVHSDSAQMDRSSTNHSGDAFEQAWGADWSENHSDDDDDEGFVALNDASSGHNKKSDASVSSDSGVQGKEGKTMNQLPARPSMNSRQASMPDLGFGRASFEKEKKKAKKRSSRRIRGRSVSVERKAPSTASIPKADFLTASENVSSDLVAGRRRSRSRSVQRRRSRSVSIIRRGSDSTIESEEGDKKPKSTSLMPMPKKKRSKSVSVHHRSTASVNSENTDKKPSKEKKKKKKKDKDRDRESKDKKKERRKSSKNLLQGIQPIDDPDETPKSPSTPRKKKDKKRSSKTMGIELPLSSNHEDANSVTLSTHLAQEEKKKEPPDVRSFASADDDAQNQEILRLHHQLSEALQKVVATTEEQMHHQEQFQVVSAELSRVRVELQMVTKERDDLKEKLEERDGAIQQKVRKIETLEKAIEKQLDEQDRLLEKLYRSEDEVEKLLIEIQDLETAVEKGEGGGGDDGPLRMELKEAKKTLVDKQREVDDQKSKIEHLEKELAESSTVNKLQIDELESEKKALQGKLKGDRLELSSKLAEKEEIIMKLEAELSRFKNDGDLQDLGTVKAELGKTRAELEISRNDVEVAQRMLNKAKEDKDDLVNRNNALNDKVKVLQKNVNELSEKCRDLGEKVLQWTEKTYEWKSRAESAEKKVENLNVGSDDGSDVGNEAPQGLFLQAVMDRRDSKQRKRAGSKWNLFGSANLNENGEEMSPEEIRIKTLEERNQSLEATIAELQSQIVKMKTAHKEEAYSTQKKILQLQGENDALSLKNSTLEQLCNQNT